MLLVNGNGREDIMEILLKYVLFSFHIILFNTCLLVGIVYLDTAHCCKMCGRKLD
jgi:hypothetical protein